MPIERAPEPTPDSSTRSAGTDVGHHQDRPDVLGVDDLGAAGHLQDEVAQRRTQDRVGGAAGRAQCRPLAGADDLVVGDVAGVGVELLAGLQRDEVAALLGVEQQDQLTVAEREDVAVT